MEYLAYSVVSWIILLVCGLPFALIFLPRSLKWSAIPASPLFGYSYIVFVSYQIFRSDIGGSDVFAPYLLIPPVLLLAFLGWRGALTRDLKFPRGAQIMTGLVLLSFATISLLFLLAGGRAVSIALSNLDIVELAAVALYMKEFPHNSGIGYLGQTGWFKATADIIWFGPSMVVAVISSLIRTEPFRLQSLAMSFVACQGAAAVYAIVRSGLSLNRATSAVIGVLYATSPVAAYIIWQSFGGQMISVALMLMITALVTTAQREPAQFARQAAYIPSLVLMFSALLVTYHFMIGIMCLLLGLYITIIAALERSWRRFFVGAIIMTVTVVITGLINPLRMPALIETLSMVKDSSNGWFIPWLSPDVQIGFGASKLLHGAGPRFHIVGPVVAGVLAVLMTLHLLRSRDAARPSHVAFVLGLAVPTLLIGFYYAITEMHDGVLGSYRSFKLTATFSAFALISFGLWFGARSLPPRSRPAITGSVLAALILFANATSVFSMIRVARASVYIPSEDLTKLQKVETMANVPAITLMNDNNFDLFWAHYFTLRKPQYFEEFPYGGRDVGALIAPYRLAPAPNKTGPAPTGDIFLTESASCSEFYQLNDRMTLCKPNPNKDITVSAGRGWWNLETSLRWSGSDGRVAEVLINSRDSVQARIKTVLSPVPVGMTLQVNGQAVAIKDNRFGFESEPFTLKPGQNVARFVSGADPGPATPGEARTLGYIWKLVLIELPQLRASAQSGK